MRIFPEHILFKEDMYSVYPLPLGSISTLDTYPLRRRYVLTYTLQREYFQCKSFATAEHIPSWLSISSSKRICPEHILFKKDMSSAYPLPLLSISPLYWAYTLQRRYVQCISFATAEYIPYWLSISSLRGYSLSISSSKRICPMHILCKCKTYPLLTEHILFKEDVSWAYPVQGGYVLSISFDTGKHIPSWLCISSSKRICPEYIHFKEDMSSAYPLTLGSISPLDWAYPHQRGYVQWINLQLLSISPLD